jgi:hypothetical protein
MSVYLLLSDSEACDKLVGVDEASGEVDGVMLMLLG